MDDSVQENKAWLSRVRVCIVGVNLRKVARLPVQFRPLKYFQEAARRNIESLRLVPSTTVGVEPDVYYSERRIDTDQVHVPLVNRPNLHRNQSDRILVDNLDDL